jgi:predicted amino acid dehydrogenase
MRVLGVEDLREIMPWIPPRTVCRLSVGDGRGSDLLQGIYVETFITPDDLERRSLRKMIDRVREAIAAAEREGVSIVSLGGFTSILLESDALTNHSPVAVTTGNSLTVALIAKGLERAAKLLGRCLEDETVLVIGATGDVGSGVAQWLSRRAGKLLLTARNVERLRQQADGMPQLRPVEHSANLGLLLQRATMVVCAASTPRPTFQLAQCRTDAIVCDAGYPKNIISGDGPCGARLFTGGMGVMSGGIFSDDPVLGQINSFPAEHVAHGCLLEGGVLALAGRFEAFSSGRGRITPERVDEIWSLAAAHGVGLAPLFNQQGFWPEEQNR